MPHMRSVIKDEPWGLFDVSLLEVGEVGDDDQHRRFQCSYAPFLSEEDAQNGTNPQPPHCHLKCMGDVVDEFFWDSDSGEFVAARSKIMPYLTWYLTGNPTEAQLERCPDMERVRSIMSGVTMFPNTPFEFVVTELPEERAE